MFLPRMDVCSLNTQSLVGVRVGKELVITDTPDCTSSYQNMITNRATEVITPVVLCLAHNFSRDLPPTLVSIKFHLLGSSISSTKCCLLPSYSPTSCSGLPSSHHLNFISERKEIGLMYSGMGGIIGGCIWRLPLCFVILSTSSPVPQGCATCISIY